jgi:transposase-like protein
MNNIELVKLTRVAAKIIQTEFDLNSFRHMLNELTVETALKVELDDRLGFARCEQPASSGSFRNSSTS